MNFILILLFILFDSILIFVIHSFIQSYSFQFYLPSPLVLKENKPKKNVKISLENICLILSRNISLAQRFIFFFFFFFVGYEKRTEKTKIHIIIQKYAFYHSNNKRKNLQSKFDIFSHSFWKKNSFTKNQESKRKKVTIFQWFFFFLLLFDRFFSLWVNVEINSHLILILATWKNIHSVCLYVPRCLKILYVFFCCWILCRKNFDSCNLCNFFSLLLLKILIELFFLLLFIVFSFQPNLFTWWLYCEQKFSFHLVFFIISLFDWRKSFFFWKLTKVSLCVCLNKFSSVKIC